MNKTFRSLTLINDKYDGVIIKSFPKDIVEFEEELTYLINHLEDKKLLWIKLQIEDSSFIPLLTKYDFVFHHCNERDITLLKRLINDPVIPTATNHTLGVGAIVFDDDKILVIKDRFYDKYKLPGGHIDDSENISTALIREVYEETGVNVEFDSIICLGHFTPGQFNESNLYVVCKAKPLSYEIDIQDTHEILEAKWMEIDEFINGENTHPYNISIVKTALESSGFKLDDSEDLITRDDLEYELFK
jgi:8-oxo-dGTP diphosphatase